VARKFTVIGDTQPEPDPVSTPVGLGPHGAVLWAKVMAEYDVSDCGGREMLAQACTALDRAEKCRDRIDRDGECLKTKAGLKEHPLIKVELMCRSFVVRTLARLGLNFEPLRTGPGRPPGYA
jgi:Phage terminase, small subunit